MPAAPTVLGRSLRAAGTLHQTDTRRHHRTLLLQHLFGDGPASRADLARATGLTRATVSDLVGDLLADQLVEETGPPPGARVGKPPTLVAMAHDASRVVALDLSAGHLVRGALTDLAGTVVHRLEVPSAGARGDAALDLAASLAADLVAYADRPVLGVGIGTPGVVGEGGVVLEAPNLGWHDVPVADRVAGAVGVPVHVANDANAAALAEHTRGAGADGGLMVVRVGAGVGAGLVLGGMLLPGHGAAAGEIGHVSVVDDGEACACGRNGCLETLLAVPRLRARLAAGTVEQDAVLAEAGTRLGEVLAPVVATLDLRELVLSGPDDVLVPALLDATRAALRRRVMAVTADALTVRTSGLGDDAVLVGAAGLVLAGELGVS